jgi:hypothetical protein
LKSNLQILKMKNCETRWIRWWPEVYNDIGLGGKSVNYWKIDKRQFQKWRGVCRAYRNPILEFDVGQMSFENKGKAYKA